jgi:ABC-type antimicrobial peptide transport system permease subunit
MSIPFNYNLRNLAVRKTTSIMTAVGIALTVTVLLAILALLQGLRVTLSSSGDPLSVIVLRRGSESELVSNISRAQFQDLKFMPGIARGRDGQPLASLEIVTAINLAATGKPQGTNITVRGLSPAGIEMRNGIRISSGKWFAAGRRELVAGQSVAARFADAQIGKRVHFLRGDWEIVGVMDAGHGAQASEIWGDLNQLSSDLGRADVLSSMLVRAVDAAAAKALVTDIGADQRLNVSAIPEKEFFELQTRSAAPIRYTGMFIALIMGIGSSFAAMNTMYAAVARRAREIGTLRVLGFPRGSILFSFFLESVLLSALGGLVGCALVLPLNGLTTQVGSGNFTEMAFAFHVTPEIMLAGIALAVLLGCAGGFMPALAASNKDILSALRGA